MVIFLYRFSLKGSNIIIDIHYIRIVLNKAYFVEVVDYKAYCCHTNLNDISRNKWKFLILLNLKRNVNVILATKKKKKKARSCGRSIGFRPCWFFKGKTKTCIGCLFCLFLFLFSFMSCFVLFFLHFPTYYLNYEGYIIAIQQPLIITIACKRIVVMLYCL